MSLLGILMSMSETSVYPRLLLLLLFNHEVLVALDCSVRLDKAVCLLVLVKDRRVPTLSTATVSRFFKCQKGTARKPNVIRLISLIISTCLWTNILRITIQSGKDYDVDGIWLSVCY